MNCEKIRELLYDYVNGELDAKTSEEIRAHIDTCEECKKEYEFVLGMLDSLNCAEYEAPAELHSVIMSGVAEEKKRVRRIRLIKKLTAIGASAAVFALVVNAVLTALKPFDKAPESPSPNENDNSQVQSIVLSADTVFVSKQDSEYNDDMLTQSDAYKFVGEWNSQLSDGTEVTMRINEDLSVDVCVKNAKGIENYYDGTLTFSNGKATLSQSDGNVYCKAVIEMCISEGKLFMDIVSGSTPWKEAL